MSNALKNINRQATAQTERARPDQVKNNAGGYTFKVDLWDRVRRFLILGVDKGTYYVREQTLARQNADAVSKAIKTDTRRLVDLIVEVSDQALAAKNSPALFALALALTDADDADKAYVRAALPKVARTGTHLFEFAQYVENLGGWGRSKRKALAAWYEDKDTDQLAYQAVKYRQRNGWTHRDVLRLAHPQGVDPRVGNFILGKDGSDSDVRIIAGFRAMQAATSVEKVLAVLNEYDNLPWETIPTQFLRDERVWKALFEKGALGQSALLRNVKRFVEIGAFSDLKFMGDVASRLRDPDAIKKGRLHPINYLNALGVVSGGPGSLGGGYGYFGNAARLRSTTNAPGKILGALEDGFYAAFGNVEPANKRFRLAIDTSGSMTWDAPAGLVGLDAREAAAAMAMVTYRTEPYVEIIGFGTNVQSVNISDKDSLKTVIQKIGRLPAYGTDCSQPMVDAQKSGAKIDVFVVYTDNETWAGRIQPFQALKQYRKATGINAKLIVVGMTATDFTIADPSDSGMMDVVGFDASAPRIMAEFARR